MVEPRKLPIRLVLAMALAAGLTPLNSTMLSVVLRPIGGELGHDEALLTRALVTSYLVTSIVMQAPGGKLGDRVGHRIVLACGQGAFALAALLGLVAPSLPWLVISRITMAMAGALIVPSATALLRNELPPEVRGRAFGAFGATMALSAAVGPVLGGQLSTAFGWRAVFAVSLVILPISALLAGTIERRPARATAEAPFDVLGSVVFGAALASLALGVRFGQGPSVPLLLLAPVLFAVFALVERRQPAPVVDFRILRRPAFTASGAIIALHNLAMYALLFELPTVSGIVLGAQGAKSGTLLLAVLAPMVVLSPIAGRLTDSAGSRAVAISGTGLALLGMGILVVTPFTSLGALLPGLLVFGVGLGLSSAPSQSAGMTSVSAAQSGAAAGVLSTMRYLGGVAGTLVLAVLLVQTQDVNATLAAHRAALLIFLGALGLALGCAFFLPGKPARP